MADPGADPDPFWNNIDTPKNRIAKSKMEENKLQEEEFCLFGILKIATTKPALKTYHVYTYAAYTEQLKQPTINSLPSVRKTNNTLLTILAT